MLSITNSNICHSKTIKADFFTDSQGRGIPEIMEDITKGEIKLSGLVSSGAIIQTVLNNAAKSRVNLNPIVIIAGTNNILQKSTDIFYTELENKLSNLGKDRAVCITTSLNDTMHIKKDPTHDNLALKNNFFKELVLRLSNVFIIDLDKLKRCHYTSHGLHLNY